MGIEPDTSKGLDRSSEGSSEVTGPSPLTHQRTTVREELCDTVGLRLGGFYIDHGGAHADQFMQAWRTFVRGDEKWADSIEEQMLIACGNLLFEYANNGNCNWPNVKLYVDALELVSEKLLDPEVFSTEEIQEIQGHLEEIATLGRKAIEASTTEAGEMEFDINKINHFIAVIDKVTLWCPLRQKSKPSD